MSEWGGGVAPPALGTMVDPVPAAGTDHVLALTGEDFPRGRLQADWTLQVRLLCFDGLLLLLDSLGQEADKTTKTLVV